MVQVLISKVMVPAIDELVPKIQIHEPKQSLQAFVSPDPAARTHRWHKAATLMARNRRGIFPLAKRTQGWGMPRRMAFTPDFKYEHKVYRSNPEKAQCYVNAT